MDHPRRYNVERSCVRCHEHKIKCDKGSPCSKCKRQNVTCQYPGPSRVKRQAPKKSTTDVAVRLEQLEQFIASMIDERPTTNSQSPGPSTIPPTPNSRSDCRPSSSNPAAAECPAHQGFLGKDGRYINEPFLSRVLEKEQELKSAIESPVAVTSPHRLPMLRADGIFTNPLSAQINTQELFPSRWEAVLLWQTFIARVEPLVKVLHVPTAQSRIFAAINQPESVRADVRALLFAICFAATTSLLSDDARNEVLHANLRRYQHGMELSLYHAEFLDSPTLTSLQAMVIYQACFRFSNSGRSGWILHGVTIRAAQSIGLHRDGKHFKLPQLECELRRRTWGHIKSTDSRVAEDHGLTVPESNYGDTELPLNVDDQSLSETNIVPAVSENRWTELTFSLIVLEINSRRPALVRSIVGASDPELLIAEFKGAIEEKYLRHSDPNIPIQRFGFLLGRLLLTRIEVCIRQKQLQSQGPAACSLDHNLVQDTLAKACYGMEIGLEMNSNALLRGFRWMMMIFTQYHLFTFILWTLCVYPTGPHVERAWRAIDMQFDLTDDPSWPDPGPKWPMIVQLRNKARRIRQAHEQSHPIVHGNCPVCADGTGPGIRDSRLDGGFDIDIWDPNFVDFSDWNSLAQSLSLS
ncbi:transcriptional regulator family: Fungal Specific TF [Penicillium roqueforti]|nr:transcriptional regulator family: Fungal Specific TF [Penicillium roqueforti]KAI3139849.1 transcriptional regulator family: Fungal Specific TF [Penicillium roqueforti]KAI3170386.1 transcriptional regulator family: Fungal Specific TF [Penicillium roqueforti]KAI3219968.1 transcriptional regulator family: Fungal Specific TF [Penicillium roqueforti]